MHHLSLILFCRLLMSCVGNDVAVAHGFLYHGFASSSNLSLDGAASITQDGILTLTGSSSDIQGHGFHPHPITLRSSASFSATFVFTITTSSYQSGRSSDGMAFVISLAPVDFSTASAGAYLGLVNHYGYGPRSSRFFAIELDTVADPELEDIDDNHVGVDLNSLKSVTSTPAGYRYNDDVDNVVLPGFEALRLSSGYPMQVWVDYDGASMRLNVTLGLVPMFKPSPPLLSSTVNLSDVLGISPACSYDAYVGFSASTGDKRGATHQILGLSFNMGGPAMPLNYSLLPIKQERQDGTGASKTSFIRWLLPAAVSVLGILVAGVTSCLALWCRRKNTGRHREDWEAELGPRRFAYKDLHGATDGFSLALLLGKGGFGRVYAGVLPASGGARVAVKRISTESTQGLAQFTAEIIILGRLRHRNLVRLVGYCRHKDELLLVYEHMPNGSLDRYLHVQSKHALLWPQRFRIIKGVASGLLYLHEDWEQVILHRDVKASNVLVDGEMNGRLGDFGLARLHDHGADAHTTHVAGTRGYLAPELMRFGRATKATDVFAFGAFILEVACGRRPVGLNARGETLVLVDWVRDVWSSGSIADAMDPRLLGDHVDDEVELVLKLGLLCSHTLPAARPGMRLVMQYLDGDLTLPEFSQDYLRITDVEQVLDGTPAPSVATTITGLSGGR